MKKVCGRVIISNFFSSSLINCKNILCSFINFFWLIFYSAWWWTISSFFSILHRDHKLKEEKLPPSSVFKDFLIIICILVTVNSFAAPETVEVPEDAENYYSEEISSSDLEPEVTIIKRKDSVKIHEFFKE